MKQTTSKLRFWLILTVVNVAVMAYPVHLYLQAESIFTQINATVIMWTVAVALVITDLVGVIIAYAKWSIYL
jgi:hypothetical protein